MAKFAPVVPTQIAQQLQSGSQDYLGDYHLLLAHDILDKPKVYGDIYGHVREKYPESFIIMDNSIIELGKPMEMKDLVAASQILFPDCIVIPDVMCDGEGTRANAVKFCREYVVEMAKIHGSDAVSVPPLMGVLQGSNVDDVMETLAIFYSLPMIDFIGIPRILTKMHGSRMPTLCAIQKSPAVVKARSSYASFKGFHLLGFSDDILDDVACARVPWIQGIDSAVPIRAAKKGIQVSLDDIGPGGWSDRTGPRGNFWEDHLDDGELAICRDNLDKYRGWITPSHSQEGRKAA